MNICSAEFVLNLFLVSTSCSCLMSSLVSDRRLRIIHVPFACIYPVLGIREDVDDGVLFIVSLTVVQSYHAAGRVGASPTKILGSTGKYYTRRIGIIGVTHVASV